MLTISHVRAFCAEAGANQPPDGGGTNGVEWHLGPVGSQATCPDCFREITSGMTICRPAGPVTYRFGNPVFLRNDALWVCVRCFDWSTHVKAQHTRPDRPLGTKGVTEKGAAGRLDKLTPAKAPRFRVVARDPETFTKDTSPLAIAAWRFAERSKVA